MYITSESLKEFVENNSNLVQNKKVADNMYVFKYKRKVFYKNLWNEFLEECRGTLIDSNYNIISMPFKKIYIIMELKVKPLLLKIMNLL